MRFGFGLLQYFDAEDGAFSVVTEREEYDSQLTVTGEEALILESYFGTENIHVGKVALDPVRASKEFLLYPKGSRIGLNIIYPKPDKTELRLYLSIRRGFKPSPGDVWFTFLKNRNVWVGSMNRDRWDAIRNGSYTA